ncbi:MAG TPA: hypothetical protein VGH57_16920 [Amycolatopsis sp.]|jgi:hypothetical protein
MTGLTGIGDRLAAEFTAGGHVVAGWFDNDPRAPRPPFTPHDQVPAPSEPPVPSQQDQPQAPAQPENPTQEELMSLSADLQAIAGRLDAIGEDSVAKLEQVKASPDKGRAFDAVAALPEPLTPAALAMVQALEALAQQPQ